MSRIGKKPVPVAGGVKVAVQDHLVKVEGPKGKLELNVHPAITVKYDEARKNSSSPAPMTRSRARRCTVLPARCWPT